MNRTKIEWCDATLNPVVGCTYNCEYCYAANLTRWHHPEKDFTKPEFYPERLEQLKDTEPQRIFLTSMSDPADWQVEWTRQIIAAMVNNPQHQYLLLSKRPGCFTNFWYQQGGAAWRPENVWFGTSVTRQNELHRLTSIPAGHRFVSVEPILEAIDVSHHFSSGKPFVDWLILGAETGRRVKRVVPHKEWIMRIVKYCDAERVPVFMKDSLIPVVGEEYMRRDWPSGLMKG